MNTRKRLGLARISVVVTCYNLARYIGEAIDSVLAQDIAEAVELIVVDDASTDQSRTIASAYQGATLLVAEENTGVLLAMLRGIKAARGEFIFLLDGDDRWATDKLRRCMELFDADPAMVFTTHDLRYIDSESAPIMRQSRVAKVLGPMTPPARSDAIRNGILRLGDYVWLGSAIGIRRSLADLEGFAAFARALPDPRNTYQDWPLAMWLASRSPEHRFGYVPGRLFDYRIHAANHSGDARTLERARRNFRRTRNTTAAMLLLAEGEAERTALKRRLALNDMQIALYDGLRGRALRHYVQALPLLVQSGLARETARVAIGVLLGSRWLVRATGKART